MRNIGLFLLAMLLTGSIALAQNNNAVVEQYGTNLGIVTQTGDDNDGFIYQGENGDPVTNTYMTGYNVGSWIEQTGNRNYGKTEVFHAPGSSEYNTLSQSSSGNANATKILQIGDENVGRQIITGHSSYKAATQPVAILIDQYGNSNEGWQSTVPTFGTFSIQDMKIDQDGADNFAKQVSVGGRGSVMKVKQDGNNNNNSTVNPMNVSCTGQVNPLALSWTHKGSQDYSQYQYGEYSDAMATVVGNNNNTAQYQETTTWGGGYNDAYIDIAGDGNDAVQGQLGHHNLADIDITGNDNVAANSQFGNSNIGDIDIMGSNNCAGIEQVNDLNTGVVYQNGNNNKGLITQHPAPPAP
ncbi:MAG: hypothetical protein IH600_16505 [Bacteroidetes bacterium]|nr:hypothetical protein [Bacteroidota bacterium]